MTDEWFDEYTYEVVVDKKYLSKKIFKYLDLEPIVLETVNWVNDKFRKNRDWEEMKGRAVV